MRTGEWEGRIHCLCSVRRGEWEDGFTVYVQRVLGNGKAGFTVYVQRGLGNRKAGFTVQRGLRLKALLSHYRGFVSESMVAHCTDGIVTGF